MASAVAEQLRASATGQAPAGQSEKPYDALKRQLERSKSEFLPLMGNSAANVDKFIRVVLNAVLATPDLLGADRRSLIASCMKAAQDGLMPDGREAVLNIYRTNTARRNEPPKWADMVQYLPMVGGLIKKLYDSGEVTYIDAAVVYANDRFVFRRGDNPSLEHEPTMADDAGPIVAAYAVIKLRNGETKREVLPMRDINRIKAASKSADSANGPWSKWLDQMAIKAVIKRIYKQLPKMDAFERIDASDNQAMGFAATPTSIAEVAMRNAPAAAEAALEYTPAETIEWGRRDEKEPAYVMADDRHDSRHSTAQYRQPASPQSPADQRADADGVIDLQAAIDWPALANRIAACSDLGTLQLMGEEIDQLPECTERQSLYDALSARDAELANAAAAQQAAASKQTTQPARRVDGRSRAQMDLA